MFARMETLRGSGIRAGAFAAAMILVGASLTGRPLAAQQDTSTAPSRQTSSLGRILGVFDEQTSAPVADAEIVDVLGEQTFRTRESGLIGLGGFRRQNDSAVVRVRKVGYRDTTFLIMLGAADTVPSQLFLRRMSRLDAMITSAASTSGMSGNMREFSDRMNDRAIHGKFVTPADLPWGDPRRLGDVLEQKGINPRLCGERTKVYVNGVRIRNDGNTYTKTVMQPDGRGGFVMKELTLPLHPGEKRSPIDVDEPAIHYQAIEVYADGGGPTQFDGCSIVLWTRQ
jgi:hypothetical protein